MRSVTHRLAHCHGIAQRQELISSGVTGGQLTAAVATGTVIRVRKGWYALPDADPQLVRATRVGGRLACISAADHYGWATPQSPGLHVRLRENAARLRSPDNSQQRMPGHPTAGTVLHWGAPLDLGDHSRLVTSKRETVLQIAHCQSPELAVAAYDSFLHTDPAGSADLDHWLEDLPDHLLRRMESCSRLCHSFLESIGRVRLSREGIHGRHQVPIPGVGRVDMLIDGWLVIEWDGLEHHDNGPAHDEDCRRDAVLASLGYVCLRFTYSLVMHHWYLVIAAIRSALARIRVDAL